MTTVLQDQDVLENQETPKTLPLGTNLGLALSTSRMTDVTVIYVAPPSIVFLLALLVQVFHLPNVLPSVCHQPTSVTLPPRNATKWIQDTELTYLVASKSATTRKQLEVPHPKPLLLPLVKVLAIQVLNLMVMRATKGL